MNEKIYPYDDGQARVYADPWKALSDLTRLLGGDPEGVRRRATMPPPGDVLGDNNERHPPDPDALAQWRLETTEAREQLVDAVRQAFEMQPFDKVTGTGARFDQCLDLMDDFLAWVKKNESSTVTTPTRPSTTDWPPPLVPGLSPVPASLPRNSSASGSTYQDCGCD